MEINLDRVAEQGARRRRRGLVNAALAVGLVVAGFIPGVLIGERLSEISDAGLVTSFDSGLVLDSDGLGWRWHLANFNHHAGRVVAIAVDGKPAEPDTRIIVANGVSEIRIKLDCKIRASQIQFTYLTGAGQTASLGDMVNPASWDHWCPASA